MASRSLTRWSLQDAKARFSEVVRQSLETGPQLVTKNGEDAVIIISVRDFNRATRPKSESVARVLARSPLAQAELELARPRDAGRRVKL